MANVFACRPTNHAILYYPEDLNGVLIGFPIELSKLKNGMNLRMTSRAAAIVLMVTSVSAAHDIITTNLTYTRDISRIFAQRCIACHGTGASIPLTTYEEARPWAVDIKEQVLSRAMPPWGAVKGFGRLEPDHALSQEELMIIAAWVIGGAPKGDAQLLPKSAAPGRTAEGINHSYDALLVTDRSALDKPLRIIGIRPLKGQTIASAKITATLPDGRVEPLVWLYRYDGRSGHSFHLREPLSLPARTVVAASSPLRFALETATDSSRAR